MEKQVSCNYSDYEKGRAVTPPAGPKRADAGGDVWLLVPPVSRPESAPSAGRAPPSIGGLFQSYLQQNTSISLVITQAYKSSWPLSANTFQEGEIKASNNGGKLISVRAGFPYPFAFLRRFLWFRTKTSRRFQNSPRAPAELGWHRGGGAHVGRRFLQRGERRADCCRLD